MEAVKQFVANNFLCLIIIRYCQHDLGGLEKIEMQKKRHHGKKVK